MKNIIYIVLWALFCAAGAAPVAYAAEPVSIEPEEGGETLVIPLRTPSPASVFILSSPTRLVVDVPSVRDKPPARLPPGYKGSISGMRIGQFTPQTTRFVFELAQKMRVDEVREQEDRLEIRLLAQGKTAKSAVAKKRKPSKPVVVIDAGHGGVDPGTIGPGGTREKDVVLEMAKLLQLRLQKTGRYEAQLTRSGDYFIMLRKRIEIARKQKADIFISLHADSAPSKTARGLSVYTVSEQASDKEAEALAARENKADILGGMDLSREREDVAEILISLAQRETMNRSAVLADVLVDALEDRVDTLPNTHRFAGFAVLKAPDVPSVLIETGFLSHSKEEKLLKSKTYREKVALGIVEGIDAYFKLVGNEQE